MSHVGEQVECFHRAGDCIGYDFTHDMRRDHAVARIAVAVIDVIVNAAQGRDAVQYNADLPAPLVIRSDSCIVGTLRSISRAASINSDDNWF